MLVPLILNLEGAAPGAMSGSAALTFSQSMTLKGRGRASGTTQLTFAGTPKLTGRAQLLTVTPITFGALGMLRLRVPIQGSTQLVFNGTLQTPVPPGALGDGGSLTNIIAIRI